MFHSPGRGGIVVAQGREAWDESLRNSSRAPAGRHRDVEPRRYRLEHHPLRNAIYAAPKKTSMPPHWGSTA